MNILKLPKRGDEVLQRSERNIAVKIFFVAFLILKKISSCTRCICANLLKISCLSWLLGIFVRKLFEESVDKLFFSGSDERWEKNNPNGINIMGFTWFSKYVYRSAWCSETYWNILAKIVLLNRLAWKFYGWYNVSSKTSKQKETHRLERWSPKNWIRCRLR